MHNYLLTFDAPLTSKRCILYIYSTNIGTEYFKHGIFSSFFPLQNAVCFVILTYLVPVLFTFYIQGVLKLKKTNSVAKRLRNLAQTLISRSSVDSEDFESGFIVDGTWKGEQVASQHHCTLALQKFTRKCKSCQKYLLRFFFVIMKASFHGNINLHKQ